MLLSSASLASVSLQPIYAHEASNWPLETFAANGLFRQIAHYQNRHPEAVVISGGHYDLASLASQLPTDRALQHTDNGWVLHYPLVIAPDASLTIADTRLYLEGHHGGCLINRGTLTIHNASLASNGDNGSGFIHGWGGSHIRIEHSTLSDLGRKDYRAHGLTLARHRYQGNGPGATLQIDDSRLTHLYRGISTETGSELQARRVQIRDTREQGMVLGGSNSQLDTVIITNAHGHGLRLEGRGATRIFDLTSQANRGSGVLMEDYRGPLSVDRLASTDNREYGLQIKGGKADASARLAQLTLQHNGSDGLRVDSPIVITVSAAHIDDNGRYAVSLDGQQAPVSARLQQLTLYHNALAALHTRGQGAVDIEQASLRHNSQRGHYLAGNLRGREFDLLPRLVSGQPLRIDFTDSPATALPASPR
ncbi:poly(beta-D-mannuronate) C5 epimerase [Alcanivorax hongdengensis A-11-3]|uniref:Poly(Beta-D-mannuronate) C5 epimerase n=1 Tax=Alcanivorax hongdengensis A-11-3 TaxID=1177179 RepID=L0WBQ5_9GAMM|nr:right-handed parallel beta-helix repeat-containing protein [Alcanivorax hongdengensis]EKF74409.1 poly(beta-D-mannuronate) C5 epimerase [Alcanivorax hongdengensis A-11-3]